MKHIHDRKIIHRDIKAQNIFLMAKDNSIRLGDFGVARVLDYTVAKAKTQVGTPYYIAPEILKGRAYTNKADVWSMGILLYELCALDVPIKAANLHDLYKRIMNFRKAPALPRTYSKNLSELIDSMLNVDASKRPSVTDLLAHSALSSRITKLMSDEEVKEEFDHTVLHNENILKSGSKDSRPSSRGGYPARPYSARSNQSDRSRLEEAKQPASRPAGAARGYGAGADVRLPKPASRVGDSKAGSRAGAARVAGRGAVDKFGARRGSNQNSPVQTPKFGMGARKNSEGLLRAQKLMPGLGGRQQASPRGKGSNFHYIKGDKPNPSQTPRNNGAAKKLNAGPVGFQKQRPSSAAYGAYKAAAGKYQKPLGYNNGRLYR
jgi:serine/threonine protein kinase